MEKETKKRKANPPPLKPPIPIRTGGRFRVHDREEIADKLINWAKKDSSINLNGFCAEEMIDPSKLTKWAKECESFCQAFMMAKSILAARRELKLCSGELHMKAYDSNICAYDYFVKQEKIDQAEFEHKKQKQIMNHAHKLKQKEIETVSQDVIDRYDSLMDQLTNLQKSD